MFIPITRSITVENIKNKIPPMEEEIRFFPLCILFGSPAEKIICNAPKAIDINPIPPTMPVES
jgi:hypothetical protein